MLKTITLVYNDTKYVLAFTRESIKTMEARGFTFDDVKNKPMTGIPELFAGAFIANHKFVSNAVVEEIFDHLPRKEEFLGKLAEMFTAPYEDLMAEPEGNEGNATWEAGW